MSRARPWLKFSLADFCNDPKLKLCSRSARSVWIDMLRLMHEAEPYGHFVMDGTPITTEQFVRIVGGGSVSETRAWIEELAINGVFSRTSDGAIYSRRMVEDEAKRVLDVEHGRLGGNPELNAIADLRRIVQDDETRAADKRRKAAERQARAREKKRIGGETSHAFSVTPSRVTSVTPGVTKRDAERDEKRDAPVRAPTKSTQSAKRHGVKPTDIAREKSLESRFLPLTERVERKPRGLGKSEAVRAPSESEEAFAQRSALLANKPAGRA